MHKEWLAASATPVLIMTARASVRELLGKVFLLVVVLVAWPPHTLRAETAAELIEQAKQYDCGYTAGPEASQAKALETYQKALAAGPDSQQRLRVLFRMAQLHSSAYLVHKGEAPNYPQAISLYERILATYSTEEPLVVRSMTALADCFVNLRRFDEGLYWSRRTLAVNTRALEDKIKAWEVQDPSRHDPGRDPSGEGQPLGNPVAWQRELRQVHLSQCAAVDQIADAALRLDPLWAQAELQALEEKYPGTCIAQRARAILDQQANAIADVLAPRQHIPLDRGAPALQSISPAAPAPGNFGALGLSLSPATPPPADDNTLRPRQTEDPPLQSPPSRVPRAPPLAYLGRVVSGAASLIVVAGAALLARKFLTKGTRP